MCSLLLTFLLTTTNTRTYGELWHPLHGLKSDNSALRHKADSARQTKTTNNPHLSFVHCRFSCSFCLIAFYDFVFPKGKKWEFLWSKINKILTKYPKIIIGRARERERKNECVFKSGKRVECDNVKTYVFQMSMHIYEAVCKF